MNDSIRAALTGLSHAFRMAVPGIFAAYLFHLAQPYFFTELNAMLKEQAWAWGIIALAVGMTFYGIHRSLLMALDFLIFFRLTHTAVSVFKTDEEKHKWLRWNVHRAWAQFLNYRFHETMNKTSAFSYLEHRWAMVHSMCVIAEVMLLYTFICDPCSFMAKNITHFRVAAITMLTIGFFGLINYSYVEKCLTKRDF